MAFCYKKKNIQQPHLNLKFAEVYLFYLHTMRYFQKLYRIHRTSHILFSAQRNLHSNVTAAVVWTRASFGWMQIHLLLGFWIVWGKRSFRKKKNTYKTRRQWEQLKDLVVQFSCLVFFLIKVTVAYLNGDCGIKLLCTF